MPEWPLLGQLQVEAFAQFDRQFHRLTCIQRDIERLRALHLEGYDARTAEVWHVLKLLEASVKALADEATRAPATFVEMQACVTALMTGAARIEVHPARTGIGHSQVREVAVPQE